jgi:HK97 family phage portal protein
MGIKQWILEKLNPVQEQISGEGGQGAGGESQYYTFVEAYNNIESVRRGVDLIVNGAASFDFSVAEKISGLVSTTNNIRKTKVYNLLNFQPNLYQDQDKFRRLIYSDLLLEGNAFIYWDGSYLYHLPAQNVTVNADPKTYIKNYTYSNGTEFLPTEVIHIMDNSSDTIFRGTSRLRAIQSTIQARENMTRFQENFFKNGAVPGLVLKSPNVLGDKVKQRLIESWTREYNPTRGGKRPLVLDGGLDIKNLSDVNFKELDFEQSIQQKDREILMALGVPPLLLDGGNNANIAPNLRLFYLETVLPMVRQVTSGFERFFGYNLEPEASKVSALQPDMRDAAAYYTTLVNGGVISPNEARVELRYDRIEGHDDLRIPANIAGSASDPSQGGRPQEGGSN